jgi:transposase-like protein
LAAAHAKVHVNSIRGRQQGVVSHDGRKDLGRELYVTDSSVGAQRLQQTEAAMTDLTKPIYNDEEAARAHLEAQRWPDGSVCPFCNSRDQARALGGKSMGPGWYYCSACQDKFTVRTGSVLERSHVPLHKWALAFRLLCGSKKSMSAHQLHRTLGVTYKTAWFMAHRIREAMRDTDTGGLGGEGKTVEPTKRTSAAPKTRRTSSRQFSTAPLATVSSSGW